MVVLCVLPCHPLQREFVVAEARPIVIGLLCGLFSVRSIDRSDDVSRVGSIPPAGKVRGRSMAGIVMGPVTTSLFGGFVERDLRVLSGQGAAKMSTFEVVW